MKNFFIYIVFFCWVVAGNFVLAQPGEVETKKINGKECYVHIVEAGQTLYAISRIYNSNVDKIKIVNEGVDEALDIGQIVYVPITKKSPRFKEHKVQRKETIYGISKEYGITPDQLTEANSGLKEGLKKGDIIQIPVHLSSLEKYKVTAEDSKNNQDEYDKLIAEADQKFAEGDFVKAKNAYIRSLSIKPNDSYAKNKIQQIEEKTAKEGIQKEPVEDTPPDHPRVIDDSTFYHIVQPKETMYAISKRFMVDQKTIKKMNNGLPDGLRAGDTLLLPRTGIEDKVILVKDPNQAVASMDSLPIPSLLKKDSYNVVILLPFYIDKNTGAFTSPKGSDAIYTRTKWATEFYMGALIAIDSLKKAGAQFKIHTLDTKGDTSVLKTLLTKKEVTEADLIIGPFFGSEVKVATQWAKNNQTPIVVPFATSNRILLDNPYVMKMAPSKSAMIDASVNYILEKYRGADLYLIKSTESKDKYAYERFQSKFDEAKLNYKENHEIQLKEIPLGSSSGRDINNVTTGGKVSVFIVPSSEMSMASKTLTRLNKVNNERKHSDSKFIVVGMDNWIKFDQIDFEYQNKLNLHIPSPSYTNYNNDEEIEITKKFREAYNYDPSEFALQGFDVTFYSLGGLYLAGKNFMFYHKNLNIPTVKNNFVFEQVSEGCGFENQHVYMLRIKDYELVDAQKHIPLYVEQEED